MQAWESILVAFGGQAILVAVLAYIAKSLFDKLVIRDTKQFESDLRAKAELAIEHLRNELQLKTIEHEVRFSRLHEKRAEVIAELNSLFVDALWEAESFLSPMEWNGEPSKPEKYGAAMIKLVNLYRYFDKNRIYLPPSLCSSMEDLIAKIRGHVVEFGTYVQLVDSDKDLSVHQDKHKAWHAGWSAIREQIPTARESLENEFRELLGASTGSPHTASKVTSK